MSDKPTILVETYIRRAAEGSSANSYKGLLIHALPGLHQLVAEKAVAYLPPGAKVLDLAAGSGAMCQRLLDLGFRVSATDFVRANFRVDNVPFFEADLNESFAATHADRYQGIIACEIIEHLENPRHFARQCFQLLSPGGRMVLTTPNVDSPASKASFLRFGTFYWFDDERYDIDGHITPLTQWQLDKAFTEAGFCFLWKGSFGDAMRHTAGSPRLRLVAELISRAGRLERELHGEIFVAVLERPAATSQSK
jgi:cyclopropane fatty-acyl-phospholipid synthase-like methyltransferase